jgi:hypothetical protein
MRISQFYDVLGHPRSTFSISFKRSKPRKALLGQRKTEKTAPYSPEFVMRHQSGAPNRCLPRFCVPPARHEQRD